MTKHRTYYSACEDEPLTLVAPRLKKPSMYKVIILNDDYTPMDFVVEVLQLFFRIPYNDAEHLMMKIHLTGKAVCGIFSQDIAETKVEDINRYARKNGHPLLSVMEPAQSC